MKPNAPQRSLEKEECSHQGRVSDRGTERAAAICKCNLCAAHIFIWYSCRRANNIEFMSEGLPEIFQHLDPTQLAFDPATVTQRSRKESSKYDSETRELNHT